MTVLMICPECLGKGFNSLWAGNGGEEYNNGDYEICVGCNGEGEVWPEMINQCASSLHRLEFVECAHGIMEYQCLDCGETVQEYLDCLGG